MKHKLEAAPAACTGGLLSDGQASYLPGLTRKEYEEAFSREHPQFAATLCFDRAGGSLALDRLTRHRNEFETDALGGRGESYRSAQRSTAARLTGIEALLRMLTGVGDLRTLPPRLRLLDVLGGDGLVTRALRLIAPRLPVTPILTSDMAGHMVAHALEQGLPAVRQTADFLFLGDACFDGVLIAYGSHHVGERDRASMCAEAFRVLRPGGRVVIHDFEDGSPVARWFEEIVHRWTPSGHDYRHFTRVELHQLLLQAGFTDITITDVYDPIVLSGASEAMAVDSLLGYLTDMYGLRGHPESSAGRKAELLDWLERNMRYNYSRFGDRAATWSPALTVRPAAGNRAVAKLPRLALVATGTRRG